MVWLRRMIIAFCITTCIPTAVAQTASLGTISFSTVAIPTASPLQSALPNKTASGIFNTVQENGGWISQPNDELLSALQSRYAQVSASPVAEQFAQLQAIVTDSQSTVQKRGAVLALEGLYYAALYTMIAITFLSRAIKLNSGVHVDSPSSMMQDLTASPDVIVANVNGQDLSVTVSSQAPTATASTSSSVSSSAPPWPCAVNCMSADPTTTPYICDLPERKGLSCALVYTDLYAYNVSGFATRSMDIESLTSLLAPYSTMSLRSFTLPASTGSNFTFPASTVSSSSIPSSTVASYTPPAAVTSVPPLPPPAPTMGSVVCNPWLTSYKGCHKDMDVKKLNETAEWLVNNQIAGATPMTSNTPNYTEVYNAASGVSYIANVGWIPGCTTYASQNPTYPSGNTNDNDWTYNIIYWNWLHCTGNQGLGGFTDFGCLRIGTFPNRLSGILTAPPKPQIYWANEHYC